MTRARDVANVLSTATALATDTETAALIATEVTNRNAAIAATPVRGNTASRPASPATGDIYSNTQTGFLEVYSGATYGWEQIGGIASTVTSVTATNAPSGRAYNNGSASISFTPGTVVGRSYAVTSSPGSYTASGASSPLVVTGLQSSTSYTYTVVASNNYGASSASSASSGVTATSVPQAPTIGTATFAAASATVAYTAGATGGAAATYTATSSPGSFTGTGSSPITVSGLTDGTSYTFTVTATNANGTSAASAASNAVIPASIFGAYDSIASGVSSAGGITFSNIPQTYTHLQLRVKTKSQGSATDYYYYRFNGDTTSGNYRTHSVYGNGTSALANTNPTGNTTAFIPHTVPGTTATNVVGALIIDILDYTNVNKNKTNRIFSGWDANGTGEVAISSGVWLNTSAVTNIAFNGYNTGMGTECSYALYGIKGA